MTVITICHLAVSAVLTSRIITAYNSCMLWSHLTNTKSPLIYRSCTALLCEIDAAIMGEIFSLTIGTLDHVP